MNVINDVCVVTHFVIRMTSFDASVHLVVRRQYYIFVNCKWVATRWQ